MVIDSFRVVNGFLNGSFRAENGFLNGSFRVASTPFEGIDFFD
jgi:hypothetical protein